MTPSEFRAGGAGTAIRFAVGECSLGSILVAASDGASARSCSATIPTRWCAICRTGFPKARLIGGDAEFERLVAQVVGFVEAPALGPRSAARRARHGVPAARVAGAARDPGGQHRQLHARSPRASARRRRCAPSRRPAPRTRSRSRFPAIAWCGSDGGAVGLSLGRRAQARAARARGNRRRDRVRSHRESKRSTVARRRSAGRGSRRA